jgi:tRNA dimethylallyltransferase
MKKTLILITGPTASGKTKTSVLLAKQINGEIISADSMQVYKGMDIGTAKATKEEMEGIPHYMLDTLEPSKSCNVSWFKEKVTGYIEDILARGKTPILVGGTGFYLNAVLYDTNFDETKEDTSYRESLFDFAAKEGNHALHERLEQVDPMSAKNIHPNNVKRVVRALEYYHQTKEPISSHNEKEKEKRQENQSPYEYTFFALEMERSLLYARINQRVDQMLAQGLLDEVEHFFQAGYTESATSMKAIGYKEFFPYFRKELPLEVCIEKLKQNTRQYAKRQLTWLRHQTKPIFIQVDTLGFDAHQIVQEMTKYV